MPLDLFWHGDQRLFQVFQKAYYEDTYYMAWLIGNQTQVATSNSIYNNFNARSQSDMRPYPKYDQNKFDDLYNPKPKITKENLETEFRKSMLEQQSWLHNVLKSKGDR